MYWPKQSVTQDPNPAALANQDNCLAREAEDQKNAEENPKSNTAPGAEVWKRYVLETDRSDKELVEGWNNSLDMLLIFAALFSAISTAFVLESTKDLKPDYTDTSAQTLAAILAALSSLGSANASDVSTADQANFTPSSAAIKVNILWFMSLSLSVAVALVAIVAKDWCYQFMSGRNGQILLQGRRRQLRWEGIEKWKMQEIMYILPLMMHAALLLFAAGLSLYLWDINRWVALPVVVTTAVVGAFYVVALFLPLFFRYCPFTTGLVKLFLPYWYKNAGSIFKSSLQTLGQALVPFMTALAVMSGCFKQESREQSNGEVHAAKTGFRQRVSQISLKECWEESQEWVKDRARVAADRFMVDRFMADKSRLDGQDTPMDEITSSMIAWMIAQCENLKSVDIALQALVSFKPWLPRLPLAKSDVLLPTVARLSTSLTTLYGIDGKDVEYQALIHSVILQSQSLSMMSHAEQIELPEGYLGTICRMRWVLGQCWDMDASYKYKLASKELGSISLHLSGDWSFRYDLRNQLERQWIVIQKIVSKELNDFSPADICHLIDGITKSFIYDPNQSPDPLLELLTMPAYNKNNQLRRTIGLALTTACIAKRGYPDCTHVPDSAVLQKQARTFYIAHSTTPPVGDEWKDCEYLLLFGLLGTLMTDSGPEDGEAFRKVRDSVLDVLKISQFLYNNHQFAELWRDPAMFAIDWLLQSPHINTHHTPSVGMFPVDNTGAVPIDMAATSPTAGTGFISGEPSRPTAEGLISPTIQQTKLALRLVRESFELEAADLILSSSRERRAVFTKYKLGPVLDKIVQTKLHEHAYRAIASEDGDIVPHCMTFILQFTHYLLLIRVRFFGSDDRAIRSILDPLRASRGDLPDSVTGMGFSEQWIEKLKQDCERDPQNVLDSEMLDYMLKYYQHRDSDLRPNVQEGSDSEPQPTWFSILQDLDQSCRNRIPSSGSDSDPDRQPDGAHQVEGVSEGAVQQDASQAVQGTEPEDNEITKQQATLDYPPEALECAPYI
ncbi:hypothetical protein RSOLAG1IB_11298 [Rhizoctonia solani AG-1 IB]|uniref:DUF6535 domain-containing protein n=1 Tax=Thanatephorus cucumeris (strain AG1-IB / isolate 7/3/14) TaxID=1108050 RepID=A0A0B7F536_THACB|nr:hypothetical protein RSOLAG1IB_11298 [Rhizoctonia solani AG-1 IB]